MSPYEERFTALEKSVTNLQQQTTKAIIEIEENTTIMLGVMRSQGRDIRHIYERLEKVESRLDTIEQQLTAVQTKQDEHTALLTQILARLQ